MTPTERRDAFVRDLQGVLNKHGAELLVTDNGKPWGMHTGMVEISLDANGDLPYMTFELPGYMTADKSEDAGK